MADGEPGLAASVGWILLLAAIFGFALWVARHYREVNREKFRKLIGLLSSEEGEMGWDLDELNELTRIEKGKLHLFFSRLEDVGLAASCWRYRPVSTKTRMWRHGEGTERTRCYWLTPEGEEECAREFVENTLLRTFEQPS